MGDNLEYQNSAEIRASNLKPTYGYPGIEIFKEATKESNCASMGSVQILS